MARLEKVTKNKGNEKMSALSKYKELSEKLQKENENLKKTVRSQENLINDLFCLTLAKIQDYVPILHWFNSKNPGKLEEMGDIIQDRINDLYRTKQV